MTVAAVLDASALLALLKQEKGAKKVADLLPVSRISAVNHCEVASYFHRAGLDDAEVDQIMRAVSIEVVSADATLAREAARLQPATSKAGLSLGDRFCLALAKRDKVPAITADKAWSSIAGATGVKVTVIR